MPVPHSLDDLSPVESINFPQGGDQVGGAIDDYFRAHAAIMKRDLAPALTSEGTKVTPVGGIVATDVQAALVALDASVTQEQEDLATHKESADHDERYYTKTEMDTSLAGKQPKGNYQPAGNYQLAATAWNTGNFNPNTKAQAGAQVTYGSGLGEFGAVAVSESWEGVADLPAPWVLTGLRRSYQFLHLRGVWLKNQ